MSTRPGFWRRQFALPPTAAQTVWDVLFGVALPLGCLIGDRILFSNARDIFQGSVFGPLQVFAYGFILTEVALLGLWILLRRRLGRSAAYFTGPLLSGWLFSLVTGLLLFPFSLVGLLVVIGMLGFSPWFTAFAFYRNWKMARALSWAAGGTRRGWLTLAGVVFAITPALALQARGEYLIRRLVESPASSRRLEQAIRYPRLLLRTEELVDAWKAERNPDRKRELSGAYYSLTGMRIETKADFDD
jgi:hypothetical protein